MIDIYLRCETRARWLTLAQNRNLLVSVTDQQGNPVLVPAPGVDIDEVGNFVRAPAVYDYSTFPPTLITPANLDTWWTVNVRLSHERFANDQDTVYTGEDAQLSLRFIRSKLVRWVREQGTQVSLPGGVVAYGFGTTPNRVQVIDPRTLPNTGRVWAGGMSI